MTVPLGREWEQTYIDGLDLLGLKIEERTTPWDGACGVYHPMLTEAAIRFQSEMIAETFPAQGPVKARIIGKTDKETERAAARVVADMNYQLTEKCLSSDQSMKKMLWSLSLAGAAFKRRIMTRRWVARPPCLCLLRTFIFPMGQAVSIRLSALRIPCVKPK